MRTYIPPMATLVKSNWKGAWEGGPVRASLSLRCLVALAAWMASMGWVEARVNPLVVIERQIHKSNMLIVLDTSGSMTGVPGGQFSSSTEAGVDCDNGVNCRNGGVLGVCQSWGRTCQSDEECRRGYCQKDGITYCSTSSDCPQDEKKCSATGTACESDADCLPQTGTCLVTGAACATDANCTSVGKCKYTQSVCENPGGLCTNVSVCGHDTSKTCTTPADCPPLGTSGTCSLGGTPRHGCSNNDDCPSRKTCQGGSGDTCRTDADCISSRGTCSSSGRRCYRNRDCTSSETCNFPAYPCEGEENTCGLTQDTCNLKTDNTCIATANPCSAPTNTCVIPTPNNCVLPVSSTDTCVPSSSGAPGPIRMCRIAQTICRRDSDCATTGDACGPATSRAVVAKRAIASIVNSNWKMLNFGLMTYYQGGYFPYFQNSSATTTTEVTFISKDRLSSRRCWSHRSGPAATCRIDGIDMTLRTAANSRYRVRTGWHTWIDMDVDFCGNECDMPGSYGLGHYSGSYYEYTVTTGSTSSTMIVQPTYGGQNITVGGLNYKYYKPLTDYYNGGDAPPIDFVDCGAGVCGPQCGGRWDTQLAPFLSTTDDPTQSENAANAIVQAMATAANGGVLFYWGTPTGCTLQNDRSATIHTSAYDYMRAVKNGSVSDGVPADPVACRDNYVLLITDGAANGPGDTNCTASACAAANPVTAGCTCRSILAAYNLKQNLGVKTFVVGFSGDVSAGTPRTINDNIARAGGTDFGDDGAAPFAFLAQNEAELNSALQMVIYNAVRGSYSTAPTSTSAGTQQATTVAEGKYALDSRMDFPEWKGHLLAYDLSGPSPVLAWDAYQKLLTTNWWQRRIYTWDGTSMIPITVDPTTHAVTNSATLASLGMGATAQEAEAVARWLMGDPAYGNPAILGAIINSTPLDIASPGDLPEPGGHQYFLQNQSRPHLIYVGASDGLLHAFFLEETRVGTTTYQAGTEAFAFLAPDMISVVRRLYSQGGQKPDPYTHIYGMADSPKAKSLCVRNCSDAATAVWKTVLIMPEGYGGSDTFMLDVSQPFAPNGLANPPISVMWHSGYGTQSGTYDSLLGNTISLPAFFFDKDESMDDYRVIFTSGYPVTPGSTTQGRNLLTVAVADGSIVTSHALAPTASCSQEYALLTDVATARDFARGQSNKLVASYFGDTSGQLWRHLLGGTPTVAQSFTCNHPLHFSPTIVQLDRDSLTTSFGHQIFPVQVTNSNLDMDTSAHPPSKMVIWKETAQTDVNGNITAVTPDPTWVTGGQITLTVGNDNEICGVTQTDDQGTVTCLTSMPLAARPTSTPLGVLLKDAAGFWILTMWYVPAADGCTRGQTYLTIHQIMGSGEAKQRLGILAAYEPVTSPVILGGRIYLFGSSGAIEVTGLVPDSMIAGRAIPPSSATGTFGRYSWTEVF